MVKKSIEISDLDLTRIIEVLNKSYADEWLAYHQYWLGARLAVGPMKNSIIAELEEHANDELRHAEMLLDRILQLSGRPVLHPDDWMVTSNCGYAQPADPHVKKLLEQNIAGERCAINIYKQLLEMTKDKDYVTYNMALRILEDEVEHEEDLKSLMEDLSITK